MRRLIKATSHSEIQKVVSFMSDVLIGRYEGLTFPKEWLYSLESWQWPVGSAIPLEARENNQSGQLIMIAEVNAKCFPE